MSKLFKVYILLCVYVFLKRYAVRHIFPGVNVSLLTPKNLQRLQQGLTSFCGEDYGAHFVPSCGAGVRQQSGESVLGALRGGTRLTWDGRFHLNVSNEGCWAWYHPAAACGLFQQKNIDILLIGDSLARHITQALAMLLNGNFRTSGVFMESDSDKHFQEYCSCNGQFDDHGKIAGSSNETHQEVIGKKCRENTIVHRDGFGQLYCNNWDCEHIQYVREPGNYHEGGLGTMGRDCRNLIDSFFENSQAKVVVVYVCGGLHFGLNADFATRLFYPQLVHHIRTHEKDGRRIMILIGTVHTPGPNKPGVYSLTQGNEQVRVFNNAVEDWVDKTAGITVFDTTRITSNTTSIDGTHFGTQINLAIAQSLLHFLDAVA